MSPEQLQEILKLPTHRLLAYYKKHYRSNRNPYLPRNDGWGSMYADENAAGNWNAEREIIRVELNTREHVETK